MEEEVKEDVGQIVEAQEGVIEGVAEPGEGQETQDDKEFNFAKLRESKEEVEQKARLLEQENLQLRQWYQNQMQPKSAGDSHESEEPLDLSDAVDSDALKKVVGYFEKRDKKRQTQFDKEISSQKAELKSMSLKSKDPEYLDKINKYLPGVLQENPAIKDIIARTPEHEQISVMYQFAKTNSQYTMESMKKEAPATQKQSSIEKNAMHQRTLGSASGHQSLKQKTVWDMSKDEFNNHLQDLARNYP